MVSKTVFISSTFEDLAEHRRAVWEILEGFKVAVRGMEKFGARTDAPLQTCLAEVEQSDVYVGIIAFRLGSVDHQTAKSFTQLEYEHAHELGKEILIYMADNEQARVRYSDIDVDTKNIERLNAFKSILRERHTIDTYSSAEDLAEKLKRDFAKRLQPKETPSDKPADEFSKSLSILKRFILIPMSLAGREIRLQVTFYGGVFPASRDLCEAFNLQYGYTVGSFIQIKKPEGLPELKLLHEVYSSVHNVDRFLALTKESKLVDLYARLQFTEKDVRNVRAHFFGQTYSNYGPLEYDDPNEIYVAPEGKVILLFSKLPKTDGL